jgi:hypothetical protein
MQTLAHFVLIENKTKQNKKPKKTKVDTIIVPVLQIRFKEFSNMLELSTKLALCGQVALKP